MPIPTGIRAAKGHKRGGLSSSEVLKVVVLIGIIALWLSMLSQLYGNPIRSAPALTHSLEDDRTGAVLAGAGRGGGGGVDAEDDGDLGDDPPDEEEEEEEAGGGGEEEEVGEQGRFSSAQERAKEARQQAMVRAAERAADRAAERARVRAAAAARRAGVGGEEDDGEIGEFAEAGRKGPSEEDKARREARLCDKKCQEVMQQLQGITDVPGLAEFITGPQFEYPVADLVLTQGNVDRLRPSDHIQAPKKNLPKDPPYVGQLGECPRGGYNCSRGRRAPDVKRFSSCALVANSGAVKAAPFGKSIDSHECVMRMNQAPTQGHERHVGTRTTLRMLNKKWTTLYTDAHDGRKVLLPNEGANSTLLVSRVKATDFEHLASLARKLRKDLRVQYVSQGVMTRSRWMLHAFRDGWGHLNGKRYRGGEAPSSGFIGFYVLLQVCERIAVYGMSREKSTNRAESQFSYHYFSNYVDSVQLRAHPHHSFELEGDLIAATAEGLGGRVVMCGGHQDDAERDKGLAMCRNSG